VKILVSYPKTSNDGLPTVFLEAWANLIAILSSNIDPVPDIIDDKINGYLVKPNTPKELAKGMYELLHNDRIRKKIIKNGWHKVKDYTWEKQIKKTNDLFIDIV
jgi:glycosyltransferase involved in cell wall biosynthesis